MSSLLPRIAAKRKRVSTSLSQWVVDNVKQARSLIRGESSSGYREAAGRLVAVLEKMPDLWQELHEELLMSVWLGSDSGLQIRLAEGAAGSLVGSSECGFLGMLQPRNLSDLFNVIGLALADEGRYCSALRATQRGLRLAPDKMSRDQAISNLLRLRSRALALWHFAMLNDRPRNRAFAGAIRDALEELRRTSQCGQQHACLDIGTGTGLLALMCHKLGQHIASLKVHACEQNELLFALAREIVGTGAPDDLGLSRNLSAATEDHVALHMCNSSALQLQPVDFIVCEAVDAGLLGEGFLQTAMDACARLLKPGGKLIPCKAKVYGQLVQCSVLQQSFGVVNSGSFNLTGIGGKLHTRFLCEFLETLEHVVLCDPHELVQIRFDSPEQIRQQLHACDVASIDIKAARDGTAHAVVVWWDLHLDESGKHCVSSRPGRSENHWPQVFWPVWAKSSEDTAEIGTFLSAGDCIQIDVKIFEDRIQCQPRSPRCRQATQDLVPAPQVAQDGFASFSVEDIRWLNDNSLWNCLRKQAAAVQPAYCREPCVVDASSATLPAALVAVARGLCKDIQPKVYVSSCMQTAAAQAFLAANGLGEKARLCPGSSSTVPKLLAEGFHPEEAADLILVMADAVQRSGEMRPDLLAQVGAAHHHATACSKNLLILPNTLVLSLTLIESTPLVRSSRVQRSATHDLQIDVSGLNALAPRTFEALSEARLEAKSLTTAMRVLELPLSSPSLLTQLPCLEAGQHHRLGPVLADGAIHGVLCDWSWWHPSVPEGGGELQGFGKAGAVWPEALPSRVKKGDHVLVEIRADAARGIVVVPLGVQQAS